MPGNTLTTQCILGGEVDDITRDSVLVDGTSQSASVFMSCDGCDHQAKRAPKFEQPMRSWDPQVLYAPPWCIPTILFSSPILTFQPLVFTFKEWYQIIKFHAELTVVMANANWMGIHCGLHCRYLVSHLWETFAHYSFKFSCVLFYLTNPTFRRSMWLNTRNTAIGQFLLHVQLFISVTQQTQNVFMYFALVR